MLKQITLVGLLCISVSSYANLIRLNSQEMTDVVGQGGADLSWTFSLNHQYATNMNLQNISGMENGVPTVYYNFDKNSCGENNLFCRLAISPNNHIDKDGNKKWLVFKDIQGTIQIDRFSLDGTTIINAKGEPQTAMQLTFYDENPLKIRNLGFSTLAVETGTKDKEGFLNSEKYTTYEERVRNSQNQWTTEVNQVPLFDRGQEKGFMGLNVQGNLHMSGNLQIFSYNCTGGAQNRC
jgi:hypothetical protein